jgi:hypothetical protein
MARLYGYRLDPTRANSRHRTGGNSRDRPSPAEIVRAAVPAYADIFRVFAVPGMYRLPVSVHIRICVLWSWSGLRAEFSCAPQYFRHWLRPGFARRQIADHCSIGCPTPPCGRRAEVIAACTVALSDADAARADEILAAAAPGPNRA